MHNQYIAEMAHAHVTPHTRSRRIRNRRHTVLSWLHSFCAAQVGILSLRAIVAFAAQGIIARRAPTLEAVVCVGMLAGRDQRTAASRLGAHIGGLLVSAVCFGCRRCE